MDNVMYVGLSRQMTLQRELDLVANNIANAETVGFKVEDLNLQTDPVSLPSNDNSLSTINFTLDGGVTRDFSQGALQRTGAPLDMAIEGDGFFQISTPAGTRFTRDGRFAMDPSGKLVTSSGNAVLDSGGGEITLDPAQGEPSVGKDGAISQAGRIVGKIGVMRFASLSALSKDGAGVYRNDSNVQPQAATDARIMQGMTEASNVQPIVQITRLIEVSRAYESIANIMDQTSQLSSQSVNRLAQVSS